MATCTLTLFATIPSPQSCLHAMLKSRQKSNLFLSRFIFRLCAWHSRAFACSLLCIVLCTGLLLCSCSNSIGEIKRHFNNLPPVRHTICMVLMPLSLLRVGDQRCF